MTAKNDEMLDYDAILLENRHNLPMTLEEIAAALHITRERVRQIEASALRKIRILAVRKKRQDSAFLDHNIGDFSAWHDV